MRYLSIFLFVLFSLKAQAAFEEYDVLDPVACSEFKISAGFYPDLSGYKDEVEAFEKLQREFHSKYGDGFIFNTGDIGGEHAVCKFNYYWFHASSRRGNELFFQCNGGKDFPLQPGAVFIFNGGENRWAARCTRNCGKSKNQKLYWVDTGERGEGEGESTRNRGYEKDKHAFEKRCYTK